MTRDEFIEVIRTSNKAEDISTLKEYINDNKARFYSKREFLDEFGSLLLEVSRKEVETPLSYLLYHITTDIFGRIDHIDRLDSTLHLKYVIEWIEVINTLEYTIIDKDNDDFDTLKEIIN